MKPDNTKCGLCGRIIIDEIDHEKAYNELVENFGKEVADHSEIARVCDDCYDLIDPKKHPEKAAAAKKHFLNTRN